MPNLLHYELVGTAIKVKFSSASCILIQPHSYILVLQTHTPVLTIII